MRHALLLMSSVLLGVPSVATADSFGGWVYSSPSGFTTNRWDDHVELTKAAKESFCSIAIFEIRPLASSVAIETAYEWHNVVAPTFTAKVTKRATMTTTQGAQIAATKATLSTATGTRYAGIHYAVMPPGLIGSVLLIASSATELRTCERAGADVVRSLDVDWSSPRFTSDPEARVETPQGRWAISGATSREYTFAANGTYRFHSETSTADRDRVLDETGTYTVRGNQLVLAPRTAAVTTIRGGSTKQATGSREKTTYTWTKAYDPDTDEWRIVLVPRKATARDGDLPATGYSYSGNAKPTWKFGPTEPAI